MSTSWVSNILTGMLLVSLWLPAMAQPTPRRAALLIGNGDYSGRTLNAATADAELMRSLLSEFRFDVELIKNAGIAKMQEALGAFAGRLASGDVGLLYYAGFCAQTPTDTYLIPVDFGGGIDSDFQAHAISVRELQARFESNGRGLRMIALSGCRDYSDAAWRGVALGPPDANLALILAIEPAPASIQNSAPNNGLFMIALREALGARNTDLLSALLGAASRFGTSVSDPARAQVAWKLSGPANAFWLRMEPLATAARPPADSTVRDFLLRGRKEVSGYGLYSYLLFPSRPAPSEEGRYRAVIDVYLNMLLEAGTSSFARQQLNITYIPVTGSPGPKPTPEQVLAAYDYEAALKVIQVQSPQSNPLKGPYVISSLVPLTGATAQSKAFIFQDLSSVPQTLIPLYIRDFEAQATQKRSWTSDTMDEFLLAVRTALGRVANEGGAAAPAFAVVINLFKQGQ
jgi:hypothetical protein